MFFCTWLDTPALPDIAKGANYLKPVPKTKKLHNMPGGWQQPVLQIKKQEPGRLKPTALTTHQAVLF